MQSFGHSISFRHKAV